jgi:hypothetical protein
MWRQSLGSILALVICLAGCGKRPPPLPTTYPVHGRVTYQDGTPLCGGLVQFFPQADLSVTTNATIASDGTYSLTTMRNGLRAEGAGAGPNHVIVIAPPSTNANQKGVLLTVSPDPCNVEPRDNKFDLTVERLPLEGH